MTSDQRQSPRGDSHPESGGAWYGVDGVSEVEDLGIVTEGTPRKTRAFNLPGRPSWLARRFGVAVLLIAVGWWAATQVVSGLNTPRHFSLPVLAGTAVPAGAEPITAQNVKRLTEVARWGRGAATQLAFSPDGKTFAVASSIGIYFYTYTAGGTSVTMSRFIETRTWVQCISFAPDGRTLASGYANGEIQFWKVSDGAPLNSIKGHTAQVNSVAFSPDGQTLASASGDSTVRVWRVNDGTLLLTVRAADNAYSVAFSPDGQTLASSRYEGDIQLWRAKDGVAIRTLRGYEGTVTSLAFSADGKILASGALGQGVQLWNVADGSLIEQHDTERSGGWGITLSGNGQMVAAPGYNDDSVTIWRTGDQSPLRTLNIYDVRYSGTKTLAFSPDARILGCVSWDGTIRLWRVADWSLLYALDGDTYWGAEIAYSPDGQTIAASAPDGTIQLWNAADGSPIRTIKGADHEPEYLVFSSDGKLVIQVLYTSLGASVWTWRVEDGSLVRNYTVAGTSYTIRALSPDGAAFATQEMGGLVKVWKLSDGTPIGTVDPYKGTGTDIRRIALSPGGQILACGLSDGTVALWRVINSVLIRTLNGSDGVDSLAFSPDGQTIAKIADMEMAVWRVQDGAPIKLPSNLPDDTIDQAERVTSSIFSLDGQVIVGINNLFSSPTIFLWGIEDSSLLARLNGNHDPVGGLAFSPDHQTLIATTLDRTVRLWRIAEEEQSTPVPTP